MTSSKYSTGPASAERVLSVCIPSYNRPELLERLLSSVDAEPNDVEIIICEDQAPRREEVRAVVRTVTPQLPYSILYHENETNLGYDRNLRELIQRARGRFVMFMGDDDHFVPGNLHRFIEFLREHPHLGYVLRSYTMIGDDGKVEHFRYFRSTTFFEPGLETYVKLFRKSVSLAGFTFRRELARDYLTAEFDGTLLYQLYLAAEISLRYPSAYCDIPATIVEPSFRLDNAHFGASNAERGRFVPGKVLPSNSVNFMKGFFRITEALDRKYSFDSTPAVRKDISKYSYPVLSIQRKRGAVEFLRYVRMLNREIRIHSTPYYYMYALGLLLLGERRCDRLIVGIKGYLGRTPEL